MRNYIRAYQPGGCYFFTVVTGKRHPHFADATNVERLRQAFRHVMVKHPFVIDAVVIMPDHIHTIWRLPENDDDFSTRWRLIKHFVSRGCQGEDAFWQPRFWEHLIRDEGNYGGSRLHSSQNGTKYSEWLTTQINRNQVVKSEQELELPRRYVVQRVGTRIKTRQCRTSGI